MGAYWSVEPIPPLKPPPKGGVFPGHEDVGLESRKAALLYLVAQVGHGLPGIYWRSAKNVVMSDAGAAAVRPIDAHLLAGGASEQLNDRYSQRLRLNVDKSAIQSRDCLGRDAAGALPGYAVHILKAHLEGPGVFAYEQGLHIPDRSLDAVWRPAVAALAPAGYALVGLHFDEHPGSPARVNDKCLDVGYLHQLFLSWLIELTFRQG